MMYTRCTGIYELRLSRAIRVDRLRENDFVVVGPIVRQNVGNGRECRIVGRCCVHFHFVADRKCPVQSTTNPTEMLGVVLGGWLCIIDTKKKRHPRKILCTY